MSHDRGCPCGKEPYEYNECRDKTCRRSPVFDEEALNKKVYKRTHRVLGDGTAITIRIPRPEEQTFKPRTPPTIVGQASYDRNVLIAYQEGLSGSYEAVPRGREVTIDGPCRVRIRRGRLELVVNHDVNVRWTPAGRKAKTAPSKRRQP